jgi:hypothetical protein
LGNPYRQYDQQFGSIFGINPDVLSAIGRLESGNRPNATNNWDSNAAAGTPSKGRMQFIQPTFDAFYRQAAEARPGIFNSLGPKSWLDPRQQTAVTAWALANGNGSHWATYGRALDAAGGQLRGPRRNVPLSGGAAPSSPSGMRQYSSPTITGGPDPDKLARLQRLAEWDPHKYSGDIDRYIEKNPYKQQMNTVNVPGFESPSPPSPQAPQTAGVGTYKRPINKDQPGWQFLQRLGRNIFGLENDPGNSQTVGGQHTAGSYHYSGRAVDFGDARNSWNQLNRWYNYLEKNRERLGIVELLNEGDHIHAAVGW